MFNYSYPELIELSSLPKEEQRVRLAQEINKLYGPLHKPVPTPAPAPVHPTPAPGPGYPTPAPAPVHPTPAPAPVHPTPTPAPYKGTGGTTTNPCTCIVHPCLHAPL